LITAPTANGDVETFLVQRVGWKKAKLADLRFPAEETMAHILPRITNFAHQHPCREPIRRHPLSNKKPAAKEPSEKKKIATVRTWSDRERGRFRTKPSSFRPQWKTVRFEKKSDRSLVDIPIDKLRRGDAQAAANWPMRPPTPSRTGGTRPGKQR